MAAFALPNFNLVCNVWHAGGIDPTIYPPPDLSPNVNLANGRVSHVLTALKRLPTLQNVGASGSMLFPAGTDVRDASCGPTPDVIECPAGSGRFYWVAFVDDIAKGFPNEHRWAVTPKLFTDGIYNYRWPKPIP